MAEKRASERKTARIKVRFWRAGVPDRVFTGYTTNISLGGCFIQTEQPIGTAGRIQMELTADDQGFVCEGIVARSIKAPYELRQVKPSGMGVRFLGIEELLRSLVPGALDSDTSANEALRSLDSPSSGVQIGGATGSSSNTSTGDAAPSSADREVDSQPVARPDSKAADRASRRAARHHPAAPPRTPPKNRAATNNDTVTPDFAFRIAPPSVQRLAAMYEGELQQGQLFIPTSRNAESGDTVRVELVLPTAEESPATSNAPSSVNLFGSVLKRWRASSPGEAPGRQPGQQGISLRLLPAPSALETISALVASVDKS